MKERVTLTIEREILEKVDRTINNTDVKNRSHAMELLLTRALGENKPSKAVILAGGQQGGKNPLPKAMVRVQDRPLLEHNLLLLKRHGIKDVIISIGFKGDQIKEYFGDGSQLDLNIKYLEEASPLGTAGPLARLKNEIAESFILLNSDELKDIDLEDIFVFHKRNKGAMTLALTIIEDPSHYGVAVMNGHRIMAFIEKPDKSNAPSKLISAGLYVMEPEVLKMIPEGFSMLEQDVLPRLAKEERLMGYVFSGQWFDTGTPEKITSAEHQWRGVK